MKLKDKGKIGQIVFETIHGGGGRPWVANRLDLYNVVWCNVSFEPCSCPRYKSLQVYTTEKDFIKCCKNLILKDFTFKNVIQLFCFNVLGFFFIREQIPSTVSDMNSVLLLS